MKQKIDRIAWIDIAKGIVIILMVLGHSSIPKNINNFIYSFHMPFFFFVSGMLISNKQSSSKRLTDLPRYITRKINSLLIPFLIYSIINIILSPLYKDTNIIVFTENILLNGWGGYALWFIPVFFFSNIISYLLINLTNKNTIILSVILLTIIGILLNVNKILLPWSLSTIPIACVYIMLGFILKDAISKIINIKSAIMKISISAICCVVSYVVSQIHRLDMAWNEITPIVPITVAALCGITIITLISNYLLRYKIVSKVLLYIGRHTFEILAFSQLIILIINANFSINFILKYLILSLIMLIIFYIKDNHYKIRSITFKD